MTKSKLLALIAAGLGLALPARAALEHGGGPYRGDRGGEVPGSYVNGAEDAVAVLYLEGRLVTLRIGPSASGARYASPSDGSGYVWWTKGDEATLYWRDGATAQEVTLYAGCRLAP
jgi:membrane-bound inhibitor of C-type lysozyme